MFVQNNSDHAPGEMVFSMTCSEKQVSSLLGGGGGNTVTFADVENKKRERKTGALEKGQMPSFQESEENMNCEQEFEFTPTRKQSDSVEIAIDTCSKSDLSPILSEPILIPGDNLSPSESQKNLSRSFEDSRPRSLEMDTEKDSTNSKGVVFRHTVVLSSLMLN